MLVKTEDDCGQGANRSRHLPNKNSTCTCVQSHLTWTSRQLYSSIYDSHLFKTLIGSINSQSTVIFEPQTLTARRRAIVILPRLIFSNRKSLSWPILLRGIDRGRSIVKHSSCWVEPFEASSTEDTAMSIFILNACSSNNDRFAVSEVETF